ncbi:protein SCAI, partial [Pilaira anomala]
NQKLVEEFQYLLEKSQSLFSGLRDLPNTGSHRQWRPYFEKTFEVYTKLWKFQQTHRSILEHKSNYGLKRWEVGEIASKIGQLYYHYYLRTSETNYLYEAYVFYEAIHDRQYFKDILEVKNSALMIKKMRYYARFIIVCLLLNKDENVRQLISELEGLIEEYTKSFKPPDAKEWQMVLEEINTFTEAEKKLVPINLDRTPDKIEHRLSAHIPERNNTHKLKLQEAILVGNYQKQIKFSELTLDMYRMLQSLEREPFILHPSTTKKPNESNTAASAATTTAISGIDKGSIIKKSNPHKYLLYRPSLSQLMVYISTAFKDTSEGSALLLYLSADGCAYPDQTVPGYGGGVVTNQRNKLASHSDRATKASVPSVHCLHPADLIPFTRKPLFLIVDSNNSTEFRNMPNVFDQPVMCLMSPVEYPSSVQDKSEIGSLFTLFLHTPLLGFCSVSDIGNLDQQNWDACVQKIGMMEKAIGDLLMTDATVDKNVKRFMSDDFLYYFIVRFVLCGIFLRYHSSFKDEKSFPSSFPVLPESVYVSTEIVTMLGDLTNIADVGTYFSLPSYATGVTAVPPPASVAVPSTNSPVITSQIATSPTSTMTVPPSTNTSTTTTNTTTNPTAATATNPSTTTTTAETA